MGQCMDDKSCRAHNQASWQLSCILACWKSGRYAFVMSFIEPLFHSKPPKQLCYNECRYKSTTQPNPTGEMVILLSFARKCSDFDDHEFVHAIFKSSF